MKRSGFGTLEEHVPQMRSRVAYALVALGFIGVITTTSLFFVLVDRDFAVWIPDGEVVVLTLGFLVLSRFFTQRSRFRQLFGQGA